jgi:hypothetical protein
MGSERVQDFLHDLLAIGDSIVVTEDYTVQHNESHILVDLTDGDVDLTLPAAGQVPGKLLIVEVSGVGNSLDIAGPGVSGALAITAMTSIGEAVVLLSTGNRWVALGQSTAS